MGRRRVRAAGGGDSCCVPGCTGRQRRCGWFDAAALKRAAQINGLNGLGITKLDVLDGQPTLRICTGYKVDGQVTDVLPYGADSIERCEPVFEDHPGWTESTVGIKDWNALPKNAQTYLKRIEELVGASIAIVSTGPDRAETIVVKHPFRG